jgi:hypothetical protein
MRRAGDWMSDKFSTYHRKCRFDETLEPEGSAYS